MLVVNVSEQFGSTFTADSDGVGGVVAQTSEENVGTNDDSSSSLSSMTVNQDFILPFFSTLNNEMMYELDNLHGCLMFRCLQIFPIHVEI